MVSFGGVCDESHHGRHEPPVISLTMRRDLVDPCFSIPSSSMPLSQCRAFLQPLLRKEIANGIVIDRFPMDCEVYCREDATGCAQLIYFLFVCERFRALTHFCYDSLFMLGCFSAHDDVLHLSSLKPTSRRFACTVPIEWYEHALEQLP